MAEIDKMTKAFIDKINECTHRDEVIFLYTQVIRRNKLGEARHINKPIIEKWSMSGLEYIKEKAWKIVLNNRKLCDHNP